MALDKNPQLVRIKITAQLPGEKGERTLTLEGKDLEKYIGLAWGFTQEGAFLFADHYQAKADATKDPKEKERYAKKAAELRERWAHTPAIELKCPDCASLSWP